MKDVNTPFTFFCTIILINEHNDMRQPVAYATDMQISRRMY